ncbi:hypothetical protein KSP39_PZI018158 [Platanthera zijinensis]|uniref:Uncharacterized protein n=1 Tax=Platanthera zijinensis TaxID=2320716 RepID=A0AAP0B3F0_9ASPA
MKQSHYRSQRQLQFECQFWADCRKARRFEKGRLESICQPLGSLRASWPALSHHLWVWFAAEKVYPGRKFMDYALLGDDVVIADENVGPVYASLVKDIGVSISSLKLLWMNSRCLIQGV